MAENVKIDDVVLGATQMLIDGQTIGDIVGLDKDKIEALYALAYQHYNAGNYQDALNIFKALCLYDHTQLKFYMGLAGSEQGLGNYKKAADIYSVGCVVSGMKDPKPMYFAAVCLLKAGQREDAMVALDTMDIMGREGNAEDEKFKAQGAQLLKIIKGSL